MKREVLLKGSRSSRDGRCRTEERGRGEGHPCSRGVLTIRGSCLVDRILWFGIQCRSIRCEEHRGRTDVGSGSVREM